MRARMATRRKLGEVPKPVCPWPLRASLDPGITGTGLAFWANEDWLKPVSPWFIYNLYPKRPKGKSPYGPKHAWVGKANSIAEQVQMIFFTYRPTHLYCELPQYFANEGGQMVAAAGDLVKLTVMVGCFIEMCRSMGITFVPVPVLEWKGQLPKSVVERRIQLLVPETATMGITSHSWDAVGIGLYAKGVFK